MLAATLRASCHQQLASSIFGFLHFCLSNWSLDAALFSVPLPPPHKSAAGAQASSPAKELAGPVCAQSSFSQCPPFRRTPETFSRPRIEAPNSHLNSKVRLGVQQNVRVWPSFN